MYSYYLDFLKSLKRYIGSTFPQIEHYQFSYADYAFLNYKLYQEHVKEYPMCIISLTDIITEDNQAFKRFIGNKHSGDTAQLLANNHTKKDSVVMDFKWVTMQIQIKINLNSMADLLDYHNVLISEFPKNFMFYSYKYQALINIDNFTKDWEVTDNTEGIVYRTTEQKIEAFSTYYIEPIFRINSIVKNKIINDDTSLDVNMEIKLKVPNKIGNITMDDRIVNGIQIVMSGAEGDLKSLPILIDMDNDIYSDRQQKLKRSYILTKEMFQSEYVEIPLEIYQASENKSIGIYMVDDSTLNKPNILWEEYLLNNDYEVITQDYIPYQEYVSATVDSEEVQEVQEVQEVKVIRLPINTEIFNFNELNNLQLLVFD